MALILEFNKKTNLPSELTNIKRTYMVSPDIAQAISIMATEMQQDKSQVLRTLLYKAIDTKYIDMAKQQIDNVKTHP